MKPETQTLLIHVGCIALIALCVWLSTLISGDSELALESRALLIGSAVFLWGKLGFKPANPVLDRIIERLVQREPQRVQRLTSNPPPIVVKLTPEEAQAGLQSIAPDGTRVSMPPEEHKR